MTGYRFRPSASLLRAGTAYGLLGLSLLTGEALAGVRTSFTGTFDLLAGSDDAGLDGATLEFVTTTGETWGSSPVDPSVPILSATATITGSTANDGIFSTETASPYWINEFTVTFDADLNSTSIDFRLPDADLLQVAVLTSRTATPPSSGSPVVPENWGNVLSATAITGESPTSAGNLYLFTERAFSVTDLVPVELVAIDVRDVVNLKSRGLLSVAVESTSTFDAQEIDVDTLLFGDPALSGTHIAPSRSSFEDVTDDGLADLVLKFPIPDLLAAGALDATSMEGVLSGTTFSGTSIMGTDTFSTIQPPLAAAVPEPNALALALLSLPGLLLIRRFRRTRR